MTPVGRDWPKGYERGLDNAAISAILRIQKAGRAVHLGNVSLNGMAASGGTLRRPELCISRRDRLLASSRGLELQRLQQSRRELSQAGVSVGGADERVNVGRFGDLGHFIAYPQQLVPAHGLIERRNRVRLGFDSRGERVDGAEKHTHQPGDILGRRAVLTLLCVLASGEGRAD
jgi:hypothetical protein